MADRAVNDGELGVPREVFELDKDERWQARLEEARARREIALREKAAGNAPPKKRLKPWEIEAAGKPKIEPIIQEPDNDGRVDFADRVETIRESAKKKEPADPPRHHNWARAVDPPLVEATEPKPPTETVPAEAYKPPPPDEFDEILTRLPLPRPVKKDISLVLPDAPDVAELASRYAATLEPEAVSSSEPEPLPELEWDTDTEPEIAEKKPRRRRPLWLALAIFGLALLPFTTKAPPLETGPPMPSVPGFAFQPALGVTWSMMQRPVETRSGEWVPRATLPPIGPVDPADWRPVEFARQIPGISSPEVGTNHGPVAWAAIRPAKLGQVTRLIGPPATILSPSVSSGTGDAIVAPAGETLNHGLPNFGNVPAKPPSPAMQASQPDMTPNDANLIEPPGPAPLAPLRITILSPARADQKIAAAIAADLPRRGHEVVHVKEVGYAISSRNLRYFFEGDRAEAARLAEIYQAELRDFTWYRPRPASGTTELWLSGKASPITNPVRTARPLVQTSPALEPPAPMRVMPAPSPTITTKSQNRSLLGRLFGGHESQGPDVDRSDGSSQPVFAAQSSKTLAEGTGEAGTDTGVTATDTGGSGTGADDSSGTATNTSGTSTGGSDTTSGSSATGSSSGGATDSSASDVSSKGSSGKSKSNK